MGSLLSSRRKGSYDEAIAETAVAIARAQILAQSGVWVGLLLRLGVPKRDDRLPVVICRFASNVILQLDSDPVRNGEEVRLLTLDSFQAMQRRIHKYPHKEMGKHWRRAMSEISPPNTTALSEYSEINVPRAAATLADSSRLKRHQTTLFIQNSSSYFTNKEEDDEATGYLLLRSSSSSSL